MTTIAAARTVRLLTMVVLGCVTLGVAMNATGLFAPGRSGEARAHLLAAQLPIVFYLAAIWLIQRGHAALAAGEALRPTLSTLLARLGICLFLGGVARVFAELGLVRLALGGSGPWAWFDVPAIASACVGLLLVLLAAPLRDAEAAQAELADIL